MANKGGPVEGLKLDIRSAAMQRVHGSGPLPKGGRWYEQITSEVNWVNNENKLWVSLGSSASRERLFINENSDFMQNLKKNAIEQCRGKDPKIVMETINKLINDENMKHPSAQGKTYEENEKTLDGKLTEYLSKQTPGQDGHIDLDIDTLANEGLLVCRHRGPIAASLMASMIKEGILPPGNVRQYRSTLTQDGTGKVLGAHTWAVYRDSKTNDLWMCDPRWNTANKVDPEDSKIARYGKDALHDMQLRLNHLDGVESTKQEEKNDILKKQYIDLETSEERQKFRAALQSAKENFPKEYNDCLKSQSPESIARLQQSYNSLNQMTDYYKEVSEDVNKRAEIPNIDAPVPMQATQPDVQKPVDLGGKMSAGGTDNKEKLPSVMDGINAIPKVIDEGRKSRRDPNRSDYSPEEISYGNAAQEMQKELQKIQLSDATEEAKSKQMMEYFNAQEGGDNKDKKEIANKTKIALGISKPPVQQQPQQTQQSQDNAALNTPEYENQQAPNTPEGQQAQENKSSADNNIVDIIMQLLTALLGGPELEKMMPQIKGLLENASGTSQKAGGELKQTIDNAKDPAKPAPTQASLTQTKAQNEQTAGEVKEVAQKIDRYTPEGRVAGRKQDFKDVGASLKDSMGNAMNRFAYNVDPDNAIGGLFSLVGMLLEMGGQLAIHGIKALHQVRMGAQAKNELNNIDGAVNRIEKLQAKSDKLQAKIDKLQDKLGEGKTSPELDAMKAKQADYKRGIENFKDHAVNLAKSKVEKYSNKAGDLETKIGNSKGIEEEAKKTIENSKSNEVELNKTLESNLKSQAETKGKLQDNKEQQEAMKKAGAKIPDTLKNEGKKLAKELKGLENDAKVIRNEIKAEKATQKEAGATIKEQQGIREKAEKGLAKAEDKLVEKKEKIVMAGLEGRSLGSERDKPPSTEQLKVGATQVNSPEAPKTNGAGTTGPATTGPATTAPVANTGVSNTPQPQQAAAPAPSPTSPKDAMINLIDKLMAVVKAAKDPNQDPKDLMKNLYTALECLGQALQASNILTTSAEEGVAIGPEGPLAKSEAKPVELAALQSGGGGTFTPGAQAADKANATLKEKGRVEEAKPGEALADTEKEKITPNQ